MSIFTRKAALLRGVKLPNKIPSSPGLYFFIGREGKILYIGKAANLLLRIRSYFSGTQTKKVNLMLGESCRLRVLPLQSEIEALIQEAVRIKKHRPKYNILLRDDKNYFYVVFSDEKFPRVFVTHQPKQFKNTSILGPFVSGRALKDTLRLLRKIFPYCTCANEHYRICLQSQLGLCPGYCCQKNSLVKSKNSTVNYRRAISSIRRILTGKSQKLTRDLRSKIALLIKQKKFEQAAEARDQLRGLERIFAHRGLLVVSDISSVETPETESEIGSFTALHDIQKILKMKKLPRRIEFYDGSVFSGRDAVGGMTVWQNGTAEKVSWRLFRMRGSTLRRTNDLAQIAEMLERRFAHRDWKLPDLVIVDGGLGQYGVAVKMIQKSMSQEQGFRKADCKIFVAAISKGKPQKDRLLWGSPVRTIDFSELPTQTALFLRRIRDATHRFSLRYQRRRRQARGAVN